MRIWDDDSMTYIEAEVQSIGRHSMTSGEGWAQRHGHPLVVARRLDVDPYPTVREMQHVKVDDDAGPAWNNRPKHWHRQGPIKVGRPVTNPNRTRTCGCGRTKAVDATICTGCRRGKKQRKKAA